MKKITKRFICVLLILATVLAMSACGLFKPSLEGKWECYMDMSEYINDTLSAIVGSEEPISDLSVRFFIEFDKEGTYTLTVDKEHMEYVAKKLADDLWEAVLAASAEKLGVEASKVEDMIALTGMTKESLIDQIDTDSLFEGLDDMEGYWRLDEENLYLAEDQEKLEEATPIEIQFDGRKKFSINSAEGLPEGLGGKLIEKVLPLEFKRV